MEKNIPHRQMIEDEDLKTSDFPEALQNAVRRFNEKHNTYTSTKSRMEKKGVEWKHQQEFAEKLEEMDEDITFKLTRFLEQQSNGHGKDTEKDLANRAKALGLPPDASEEKIKEAEKAREAKTQADKDAKAKADEAKKAKADEDEAEKKRKEKELESKIPSNQLALQKLHSSGKTTVTIADLKVVGFNVGFFGPIGTNGCRIGKYILYRDTQYETEFKLSKS